MARYLITDFFRLRPAATGESGGTAQFYTKTGTPVGGSASSDADGKFNLLDEIYPGEGYYTVTKAGVTKRHDTRSVGFIGTLSAADLISYIQGIATSGIFRGILSEGALSAGGGASVNVAAFAGVISGHPFRFSTTKNVALTAAHASLPRIDRIVAYLYPPGSATGNPGEIGLKAVAGTAAALPSAPALVNTVNEVQINLGIVTMAASASAPSNITSETARVVPTTHIHAIADTTGLQAALDAKAPIDSPTFTGTVTLPSSVVVPDGALAQADVSGLMSALAGKLATSGGTVTGQLEIQSDLIVDTTGQNAFIVRKADNTEIVRVDTQNGSFNIFQGADLVLLSDGGANVTFRIDGATGNITVPGVTITPTELACLDGLSVGIQAQLDAKAALSGAAFTGAVTSSGGLRHTGGTWGFNGSSVSGKQADPADISTGTIDATWGATEAAVLEDIRTNVNDLKTILRNVGMITA